MSKQTITKEVSAIICDFCDKEIDLKQPGYCYTHLPKAEEPYSIEREPLNKWLSGVKHVTFWWYRPKRKTESDYVQYDFHANCFDKLFTKLLKERKLPHDQQTTY